MCWPCDVVSKVPAVPRAVLNQGTVQKMKMVAAKINDYMSDHSVTGQVMLDFTSDCSRVVLIVAPVMHTSTHIRFNPKSLPYNIIQST